MLFFHTPNTVRKVYERKSLIKSHYLPFLSGKFFSLKTFSLCSLEKSYVFPSYRRTSIHDVINFQSVHFLHPIAIFFPFPKQTRGSLRYFPHILTIRIAQFCSVWHFVRVGLKSLTKKVRK